MGVMQLRLQARLRVSKIISSTIWQWEFNPSLFYDSSRSFSSNSIENPSPHRRRSSPDPRDDERRFSRFSGDNQSQRINKPSQSQSSSFRFPNEVSISERNRDSSSQTDFSFLEKFKLNNSDNQRSNKEKIDESVQENEPQSQSQPQRPPEADEIFKKMKETGLIPNAVAMLDGLCKDGLVQEAMKLFNLMREKGKIPEVVIYTAVVDGFCKAEKLDEAIRIFRKMQTNGISPNAFSFAVLIQGLYKCYKLEEAIEFCLEMLESGQSPNVTTFVGLIDELCKERGMDEARSVIETLKQKGFLINEKALREFLNKKAPFSPMVWEAIFGKKTKEFF